MGASLDALLAQMMVVLLLLVKVSLPLLYPLYSGCVGGGSCPPPPLCAAQPPLTLVLLGSLCL